MAFGTSAVRKAADSPADYFPPTDAMTSKDHFEKLGVHEESFFYSR